MILSYFIETKNTIGLGHVWMERKSGGKLKKAPFKVGETVESDFSYGGKVKRAWIKYRVKAIRRSKRCQSGYSVNLVPLEECPCCKRPYRSTERPIDSYWCRKIQK